MEREDRLAWKDGVCVWRGGGAGGGIERQTKSRERLVK